ncbi:DUF3786 domain-containing protein [Desulfolucanica intricata]|uniref:DUF3786 domain-containing protein n=1 Tax=Desulfolucanica intricata TaxID=1285191 RepID=UPI00082D35FE|nr:DUF3786 domain-containing protein [Desulfolucanica intricata]
MPGPKITAYQEALEAFLSKTPEEITIPSGAQYFEGEEIFTLTYCGNKFQIERKSGKITPLNNSFYINNNDETLILQYLTQSSGLPPRGNWISFLQLPFGELHHAPFQKDAIYPLAQTFGNDEEGFLAAGRRFGGESLKMGDYAFVIPAFPKIPLAVALWLADDEFPAKANILFDETAALHLSTAALWVLGVELAEKMMRTTKE